MRPWAEEETRARSEVGCDSPMTGGLSQAAADTWRGRPAPTSETPQRRSSPATHPLRRGVLRGGGSVGGASGLRPRTGLQPPTCFRGGQVPLVGRRPAGEAADGWCSLKSPGNCELRGSREPCPRWQAASTPVALTPSSEPCLSIAASQNTIYFVAQLKPDSGRPENPGVRGGGPRGPRPPGRRGWLLPGSCSPRARRGSEAAMFDRAALPQAFAPRDSQSPT